MCDELADVRGGGGTDHRELDHDLLKVGGRIVDVVFLGVPEGRSDVRRSVLDRDLVEWREPRQLGEQSKRGPHHQVLQRRRAFLRATACQRLVGLDHKVAHPALEVDVVQDASDRPRGGAALLRRFGAHLLPQTDDFVHLLAQVDATRGPFGVRHASWLIIYAGSTSQRRGRH